MHRLVTLATIVSLAAATLSCCRQRQSKPNQQSPLTSPGGKYVLTVPIEKDATQDNLHYWQVQIADSTGNVDYKDTEGFLAFFNVLVLG